MPIRRCIVCGNRAEKEELFRVVKYAQKVTIDKTGKAQGRGAYVCKSSKCIEKAIQKGFFQRHLKTKIDSDILQEMREMYATVD